MTIRTEIVEDNGDLHISVSQKAIIMSQEHNLVLVSKPVVRNSNICRASGNINETIWAVIECVMVYPNLA